MTRKNLIKCLTPIVVRSLRAAFGLGLVTTLLAACVDSPPPVTAAKPKASSVVKVKPESREVTIGDDNITFKQLEREPPSEIALQALVDAGLSTPPPEVEQPTIVSELPPAVIEDDDLQTSLREIEESGQMVSAIINELEQETDGDNASTSIAGKLTISGTDADTSDNESVTWTIGDNDTITTAAAVTEEEAEPVIPEGEDPSLGAEALAAAFALARQSRGEAEARLDDPKLPEAIPSKPADGFRIALMLPAEGPAAGVSQHIREGAEFALFKLAGKNIDMIFLDSENPDLATAAALANGADMILGPVFANKAQRVGAIIGKNRLPVLTFSNDSTAAGGNVMLLGQTPEQEIETVLAHALIHQPTNPASGREKLAVAIISQDKIYGRRVANHAASILNDAGLPPVANITLDAATLASEDNLRRRIRRLTGWVPPSGEGTARVPNFDIVIIAGDPAFSLRVAPVLAWYDLDPEKVRYLGTSLWASPAILQEPSLRGGWYAAPPQSRERLFVDLWRETGKSVPNRYTMIGFDAVALASTLARMNPQDPIPTLTQKAGFAGFSGMFRLLPDGRNIRLLDVREITEGGGKVIASAPKSF